MGAGALISRLMETICAIRAANIPTNTKNSSTIIPNASGTSISIDSFINGYLGKLNRNSVERVLFYSERRGENVCLL